MCNCCCSILVCTWHAWLCLLFQYKVWHTGVDASLRTDNTDNCHLRISDRPGAALVVALMLMATGVALLTQVRASPRVDQQLPSQAHRLCIIVANLFGRIRLSAGSSAVCAYAAYDMRLHAITACCYGMRVTHTAVS
jgi:hypothetical protein